MITAQQKTDEKHNPEQAQLPAQSMVTAFANATPKSAPSVAEMNRLVTLFNQGQQQAGLSLALEMTSQHPLHGFGWKVLGALYQQQGLKDQALDALKKAAMLLPKDAEVHFNLANALCDAGELKSAIAGYKKAIKTNPMFTQAHYNLGLAYQDLGQLRDAEASFKVALNQNPKNALMHSNLGVLMKNQKRYKEADTYFTQALKLNPDLVEVHYQLGVSLAAQERFEEAEQRLLLALAQDPNIYEAYCILNKIYQFQKRDDEAEACLRKVIAIKPDYAEAYFNLANRLKAKGQYAEAEAHHLMALSVNPEFVESYNNLGMLNLEKGAYAEAVTYFRKALAIKSDYLDAYNNLGIVLNILGQTQEAEAAYLAALEIDPKLQGVLNNYSVLLMRHGQPQKAQECLDKALAIDDQYLGTYINLGVNYIDQGKMQEAESICIEALGIQSDNTQVYSNLLFSMSYLSGESVNRYLERAYEYGQVIANKVTQKFNTWRCTPSPKRLKVGVVSGDLRQHAVTYFLENIAQHINHANIELVAYSTDVRADHVTHRIKPLFSEWHSLALLNDEQAANLIHSDGIHVLIDLSGHSAGNRLPVFAWKPAPVQVSWLGYWASTGVQEIDYVLTDAVSLPEDLQSQFVEKIQYLPDTRLCFTEPQPTVEVSPLPALRNGFITFGSFQTMAKVSDSVLALWAQVMQSVPNSKMRWQSKAFGAESYRQSVKQRFTQLGIDESRVELVAFASREDYFAAHAQIDILLDTFPFTGGTTTCEALWLGVPTLTMAGETMVARQGASLLTAAGLSDWVTESQAQYLEKAVQFCSDLKQLSQLRANLRAQVLGSPLFDGKRFAANLELALWDMWQATEHSGLLVETDVAPAVETQTAAVLPMLEPVNTAPSAIATVITQCEQALKLAPDSVSIHNKLADSFKALGQLAQAINHYSRSIELNPDEAGSYNNLALIFIMQGQYDQAEHYCYQALERQPDLVEAHNTLGVAKKNQGQLLAAQRAFLQAIKLKPDYAGAYTNLASVLQDQGYVTEALDCFKRAVELEPDNLKSLANLLFAMNYVDKTGEQILPVARHYGKLASQQAPVKFTTWKHNDALGKLRVGLVSGDLREHPVAFFLQSVLPHLDQARIELIAYSTDYREDAVTSSLKPYFAQWHTLRGLNDSEAAQRIHEDGVHVLIDLSGHTGGSRLPVFACKPAPVQASWLGYYATTGLSQMDYWVADAVSLPAALSSLFTEQVKYLPDSRMCFAPPTNAPEVAKLPALLNGYVTFGCFQNMAKVSEEVMTLWAQVMQAVPNTKLRWQCKSLADIEVQESVKKRMVTCGIDLARVSLLGDVSRQEYLTAHAEVDVILDTFPFSGGTTTCEALWMGVPTLTLAGQTLVARQGASLLTAVGLSDWIVETQADYVQKARNICQDLNQLASLRTNLRAQVAKSPLFDGALFARNMEILLCDMWQEHVEKQAKTKQVLTKGNAQNQHLTGDQTDQQSKVAVQIVSATRMTEQEFWSKAALGLSLKRHLQQDARLSAHVCFDNTRGLSEIFNDSILQAEDDAVMVFIHDDVWIDEANFADTVLAGLEIFDVIGVAGNKRRLPNQPAWPFVDLKFTWDDKQNLSGRVAHGQQAFGAISDYGPVPAACELLDGVFLAAKNSVLKSANVYFDPQFDFHFYDLDFCRTATSAGLQLGTWLVNLTHQSGGAFGTQRWQDKYQLYMRKWENMPTVLLENSQENLTHAVDDVYALAQQHQEAGDIEQAVTLYLEILQVEPNHAEANHNLGFIEAHTKSVEEALLRFEAAVMAKPNVEQFWVSYIDALIMSGAMETAASAIELGLSHGLSAETASILAEEVVQGIEPSTLNNQQPSPELCSNEAIGQLLNRVLTINIEDIRQAKIQSISISPDLNLSPFESTLNELNQMGRYNEILEIIFKSVMSIKLRPEFIGNKIFTPYFDAVLENINLDVGQIIPNTKKMANVVVASEIYESGGHTKVIAELLDTLENPILVITDIYDRFAQSDLFAKIAATLPTCPVVILPKERYLDKATRLAGFINTCAKNVFLVSHHDDAVAVAACQKNFDTSYYFVHHADHNSSLGSYVNHFHHVDLFVDIASQCKQDLKRDVSVLPIHAEDFGGKQFNYPVKQFSTVSAGTSNKFDFSGAINFAEVIAASIKTCGGKHYHFGAIGEDQLKLIRTHLAQASIAPESFIYMGNVPSLWNGLLEIDAHIYVGSFPKRGGKGEIEAQGAGYPLLIYKDPEDPKYLNVANCNPLTQNWYTQSDFCEGLRSIMFDHEKYALESRRFYLAHHTKSEYLAALNSLIQ
jgi:predicted O-linked N-acetylglucosamine transferase (SPINDLY family)